MENIFDILLVPMGWILRLAYQLTQNYLFAILLATIVFELILSPFAIKQQKNQIKQAKLAPKVAAIRKKYAGRDDQATKQKMNQETMELYQRENFNPASGCGTLLLQFPIIIALYQVVTRPLRYICNITTADIGTLMQKIYNPEGLADVTVPTAADSAAHMYVINKISEKPEEYIGVVDSLTENTVMPQFTTFGIDLSQKPSDNSWLLIILVVTFIVMIASQKIMQKFSYQDPMQKDQQNSTSMKIMMYTMPLMSVFIEYSLPAAIGIYWIFRSVIQTVQKIIISKVFPLPKFTEEDYKAAEKAMNSNKKQKSLRDPSKPRPRSLHHIDDEEYLAKIAAEDEERARLLEEAEAAKEAETTENSEAPAPIKNDEKSTYKKKKK